MTDKTRLGLGTVAEQLAEMRTEFATRVDQLESELTSVQSKLQQAEAEVVALRQTLTPATVEPASTREAAGLRGEANASSVTDGSSRRDLLKKGGVGAVAAVAGVAALTKPAAAADGDPLTLGALNEADSSTSLTPSAGFSGSSNLLTVSGVTAGSAFPSAIGAYGYTQDQSNGCYGFSTARQDSNTATGFALIAYAESSARAQIWLGGSPGDPRTDGYVHQGGELRKDNSDNLWYCIADGTPGTWRKLAGPGVNFGEPATAGSLHLLDEPVKGYDSRLSQGGAGPIPASTYRTVSLAGIPDEANGVMVNVVSHSQTHPSGNNWGRLGIMAGDVSNNTEYLVYFQRTGAVEASTAVRVTNGDTIKLYAARCTQHAIVNVVGYYV